jgi:hypothetical protein
MKKYIVYKFHLSMTKDQHKLEEFLNNLKGEVVAILPNVTSFPGSWSRVDFVLIVEKLRWQMRIVALKLSRNDHIISDRLIQNKTTFPSAFLISEVIPL